MGAALRIARAVMGGRARVLAALSVALGVVARLALAGGALYGADATVERQGLFVLCFALVSAVWTIARVPLVFEVRRSVFRALGRGLLSAPRFGREPDGDADLVTAAFTAEAVVAHALPALVGEALSAVLVGAIACAVVPLRTLSGALVALAVAGGLSLVARRVAERAGDRAWEALHPLSSLLSVLRAEAPALVANDRGPRALSALEASLDVFLRQSRLSDAVAGLSGRLPLLVAGGAVFFVTALLGGRETALRDALLVAALVPPFAGLAQALVDVARSRASLAALPLGSFRPPAPTELPASLSDLAVRYPGGALEVRCDRLPLREGTILVLEGENGCGKSTVLRALAGLLSFSASPSPAPAPARTSVYLPQGVSAAVGSVREHLSLWCEGDHAGRAKALVGTLGLDLAQPVVELSAGRRRRLSLACALTDASPTLLLDEPEQNLDAAGMTWLLGELTRLRGEGRRIVVASHAPEIRALADAAVTPHAVRVGS